VATASGTALGLSPALLFGVLLARGSNRIHLHRFFAVTGVVLIVLVLKLLAGGLHEFFEAGLLSSVLMLEAAVEVITSTTATWIILALLVLAPLACLAWEWWQAPVPEIPTQPNGVHPRGTAGRGRFTWWNHLRDHDGLWPVRRDVGRVPQSLSLTQRGYPRIVKYRVDTRCVRLSGVVVMPRDGRDFAYLSAPAGHVMAGGGFVSSATIHLIVASPYASPPRSRT
jgi:hypothetical protein